MRFDSYADMALLTDLYQLTMSYGYWKIAKADRQAVFHLFFRKLPFSGGYAIAAGLGPALNYLQQFSFSQSDVDYLGTIKGNDQRPLFEKDFLDYLAKMQLSCDIDAMPEGTAAFQNEPLVRVKGPIIQCQLLETALLNLINFSTLVATKAARICAAARGEPVLEFGLRRAQGPDGGLSASRAAFIGGCAATSNVLAGKLFGIPVRGTHAHSWVMAFDEELKAFEQYASAMPNNCVFLVDTYDTLEGVRKACEVGKKLRSAGHEMVGIRLDSGDLAYLSIEARKILDAAGFPQAVIVASNDLDEGVIESLKHQDAKVSVWGVGTKLATAYDQPALGGVYKLGALQGDSGDWQPKIKLSEQAGKTSIPGILQVRRFSVQGRSLADMIYDELDGPGDSAIICDPREASRRRRIENDASHQDLLQPVMRGGEIVAEPEPLDVIRQRVQEQLQSFHVANRRLLNPHEYPVGLSRNLSDARQNAIAKFVGEIE